MLCLYPYPKYRSSPSAIQITRRIHVSADKLAISVNEATAESAGSHGTPGVLNGRSSSGRVRRSTITPIATTTNANSVPMLTSSPSTLIDVNPDAIVTIRR